MFMPLLDRGGDAWRPVEVTPLEGALYRVEGPMPANEVWEFGPGTLVTCKWKKFNGEDRLVPVGEARISVGAIIVDHHKRAAGLLLTTTLFVTVMSQLPVAPEGHVKPLPVFVMCALVALVSIVGLIWWKPRSLTVKWALGSALLLSVTTTSLASLSL